MLKQGPSDLDWPKTAANWWVPLMNNDRGGSGRPLSTSIMLFNPFHISNKSTTALSWSGWPYFHLNLPLNAQKGFLRLDSWSEAAANWWIHLMHNDISERPLSPLRVLVNPFYTSNKSTRALRCNRQQCFHSNSPLNAQKSALRFGLIYNCCLLMGTSDA